MRKTQAASLLSCCHHHHIRRPQPCLAKTHPFPPAPGLEARAGHKVPDAWSAHKKPGSWNQNQAGNENLTQDLTSAATIGGFAFCNTAAGRCLTLRGNLAPSAGRGAIASYSTAAVHGLTALYRCIPAAANGRTTAHRLLAGSHSGARHISRHRRARSANGCCKSLALVISTVIAPLLVYKVLTVRRIHLIDIRDGIREVMIPHPTVALAACQQTCHHSYQTK